MKSNSLFPAAIGFLLMAPSPGKAQTVPVATAKVTGMAVAEAAPAVALPFATVLLRRAAPADTSLVASGQTTLAGTFELLAVPPGTYRLRVLALGYQSAVRAVLVAPGQTAVALGSLPLRATSQQLTEVRVTGEKALVQQELGKTVINVEKDLSSVGGMATDVLRNVPSVAVDAAGTVSLRGSSDLTILIDGKPTGTTNGGSGGPRLDQIPASRIAQIEILTNPSAKYNASGAGVINLITKKSKQEGWNGQLSAVVGTHEKVAPSLSLSRRHGPTTWTLGYNGSDQLFRNRNHSTQTALLRDGTTLYSTQEGQGTQHNRNHTLNLGLEYELTPEQTLSLSVEPHWEKHTDLVGQTLTQQALGSPNVATQYGQQQTDITVRTLQTSVDYRRRYQAHDGRELTASGGFEDIQATAPVSQSLTGGSQPGGFRQEQSVNGRIYFGQADYVRPTADGRGKLETGVLLEARRITGAAALLVPSLPPAAEYQRDPTRSFDYHYNQTVPAAYATYQRQLPHGWSAQAGLRTEATLLTGGVTDGRAAVRSNYLNLFPSATVARELAPEPGHSRLQFSYARRITRPDFRQRLPLQLYQDPRNYRTGDPGLQPEFSHNLELGHQLNLASGASFTSTVFARFTQQVIQRVRSIDTMATRLNHAGVVTAETFRNYGSTTNLGLELAWSQPLAKWWRVSANGSVYRSQIAANAAGAPNRSAWAGTARLVNNFTPRPGLDVQLTGALRSTVLTAQGRQLATGGLDMALRQRLFQERAALTLRVSDLLNTQVNRTELATPELQTSLYTKPESRIGWLGFTWYLGASKPGKKIESAPGTGGGFGG
jgi:ferric enterobactin receptor